ncbi:hypothetical protein [Stieleria neptunia]|nr:hypothetical protein [Stieleria neptunia]
MSIETRSIRFSRLAMVVRLPFALFLLGTGMMTMGLAVNGSPVSDRPDDVGRFMMAIEATEVVQFSSR